MGVVAERHGKTSPMRKRPGLFVCRCGGSGPEELKQQRPKIGAAGPGTATPVPAVTEPCAEP